MMGRFVFQLPTASRLGGPLLCSFRIGLTLLLPMAFYLAGSPLYRGLNCGLCGWPWTISFSLNCTVSDAVRAGVLKPLSWAWLRGGISEYGLPLLCSLMLPDRAWFSGCPRTQLRAALGIASAVLGRSSPKRCGAPTRLATCWLRMVPRRFATPAFRDSGSSDGRPR